MIRQFDGDLGDTVRRAWRYYGARPYDVGDNAPHTIPDLIACAGARFGRIRVWPGGTESAIYADETVNWRFRAWHDDCHLKTLAGFTVVDEIRLGSIQRGLAARFGDLFAEIVYCEIAGQAEYFLETGRFLENQRRFTLDYFARSFAPETERYSVAVLDTNGNLIMRIGQYGNADDEGIGLIYPTYLASDTDRRRFIVDQGNARILSAKRGYHTDARIALTDVPEGAKK